MAEPEFNAVLRHKINAAGPASRKTVLRPDAPQEALVRALKRAAAPYEGLKIEPDVADPVWDKPLKDALSALPNPAMLVVLEAGQGQRALCVLENGVVDALVEVQTTGRVDKPSGLNRATTSIDAALTRDFVGLLLSAFGAELKTQSGVNWPTGLTYGANIKDPKQLELLLPDRAHHQFTATLSFSGGIKTGGLHLLVPAGPDIVVETGDEPAQVDKADWGPAWKDTIRAAVIPLEAILIRRSIPLHQLQSIEAGFILPFDHSDLEDVALCDTRGRVILNGKLGRKGAKRSLKISTPLGASPAKAQVGPPAVQPDRGPASAQAADGGPSLPEKA